MLPVAFPGKTMRSMTSSARDDEDPPDSSSRNNHSPECKITSPLAFHRFTVYCESPKAFSWFSHLWTLSQPPSSNCPRCEPTPEISVLHLEGHFSCVTAKRVAMRWLLWRSWKRIAAPGATWVHFYRGARKKKNFCQYSLFFLSAWLHMNGNNSGINFYLAMKLY